MEITIDVDNNDMNLIISTTKDYIKNANRVLQKAIKVISDTSKNVAFNHVKWNGSIHNTDLLASFEETGIETKVYNTLGSNNNSVITDEAGMTVVEKVVIDADWNPLVNIPAADSDSKYGDRFVRIANGGIYLTSDGGKTFKTAITAEQIYADVIKGELLVGNELQILGNDGSDDIVFIGDVLTTDFGIVINGTVNTKPTVVSMTRDAGFHITYDSVDVFGINATGILQAKGISLYRNSGQLLVDNDKLVADYVQGDLLVGGNLSITGNDSVSDILLIGDILTTDFGIQIDGVVSGNDTRVIMSRDEGFKIEVDTGTGYEDRFTVDTNGIIVAQGLKILNESGDIIISDTQYIQRLEISKTIGVTLAGAGNTVEYIKMPSSAVDIRKVTFRLAISVSQTSAEFELQFTDFLGLITIPTSIVLTRDTIMASNANGIIDFELNSTQIANLKLYINSSNIVEVKITNNETFSVDVLDLSTSVEYSSEYDAL